jgi:hypothetical protein
MASSTEIVDIYQNLDPKYLPPKQTYANFPKVQISLPTRMLIVGASGSRKTQMVVNLMRIINAWNRIYLFAKDLSEPIYQYIIDFFEGLQKKLKLEEPILYYSNDIEELPSPEEMDKSYSNLLIVDDMICERHLKGVESYFIRGRKKNCSVFFLTQSYYSAPKNLRANSDIIILMRVNTGRDLGRICSEYSLGVDRKQLEKLYRQCTDSGNKNAFFMIDLSNPNPLYRFRKGFSPMRLTDE